MSDTFVIVFAVVWFLLCLSAYMAGAAYYRGKNRGFDHANKLNDEYDVRRRSQENER